MYYFFKFVKFVFKSLKWIYVMKEIWLDLFSYIMCICKIKIVDFLNENERLEYKEMYGIV